MLRKGVFLGIFFSRLSLVLERSLANSTLKCWCPPLSDCIKFHVDIFIKGDLCFARMVIHDYSVSVLALHSFKLHIWNIEVVEAKAVAVAFQFDSNQGC